MKNTEHWAKSLISGDRCLATIRHKTDWSKNQHNVNVVVVRNKTEIKEILCVKDGSGESVLIPYYELTQIPQPKQETIEEETLSKIKFVLLANNDAQAIRLLEQYGQHQSEKMFSEEDMRKAFCNGYRANVKSSLNDAFQDWLTQHKKH